MENFRLRVFRTVARRLNFRAAAEELRLTQPAVTQQIKALEQQVDSALFHRTAGKITLTPAGAALLPFADQLAALADEALEAIARANGESAGRLSIAASQTIAQYLLPHLIAGFSKLHPKVEIATHSGNTLQVLEELVARRAYVALIEGPALRQDVHVEPFMRDRMVLLAPATHPWAGKTIKPAQLHEASLLLREQGSGSRRVVEQALEAAGLQARDLKPRMTFNSTQALLTAVEAGLGVAFVSQWAVQAQLALGTLAVVKLQGLALEREFSLAWVSGPMPSGIAGEFCTYVCEQGAAFDKRVRARSKSRQTSPPAAKPLR
ncbi:MAG: LysR family transcriptional regulator [Acidobacteriaceae bacterium]|nr:LysR family transcriptional regulator [Acidobacteriaceae bacterium]